LTRKKDEFNSFLHAWKEPDEKRPMQVGGGENVFQARNEYSFELSRLGHEIVI